MKERPILMSGPMVRAILDGKKTQTRRVLKPQPYWYERTERPSSWRYADSHQSIEFRPDEFVSDCPYGQPGDRLWVRETWQGPLFDHARFADYFAEPANFEKPEFCEYAADGGPTPEFIDADDNLQCKWRPSIHMPRWASRITLELTGVRVERLQSISEEDALAEGCVGAPCKYHEHSPSGCTDCMNTGWVEPPTLDFMLLWNSINGKREGCSWAANPWVWVLSFSATP
jgi:hypothetical protein